MVVKNLLDIYPSMGSNIEKLTLGEVLNTNLESQKYGLMLNAVEAQELIGARNQAIRNHGRVELSIGVVHSIVSIFCPSPYINQEEYAFTLNELLDIFYYMKNETEDTIGDDELLGIMKDYFNNSCQGSLELLKNREMTGYANKLRRENQARDYAPERNSNDDQDIY